jgi:type IV pilus assembly protein PilV
MSTLLQPLHHKPQSGGLLIEGLVAMMIFSVGIVGLINLQTFANKAAAEAVYRSEAAMLANDLISRMWASDRSNAIALQTAFQSPNGPSYQNWAWRGSANAGTAIAPAAGTVYSTLPGASANPPLIVINIIPPVNPAGTSILRVTLTMRWVAPSDKQDNPDENYIAPVNNYVAEAHIGG